MKDKVIVKHVKVVIICLLVLAFMTALAVGIYFRIGLEQSFYTSLVVMLDLIFDILGAVLGILFVVITIDIDYFDIYVRFDKGDNFLKIFREYSIIAKLEIISLPTTLYFLMIIGKIDGWFFDKAPEGVVIDIDKNILIMYLLVLCIISIIPWVYVKLINKVIKLIKAAICCCCEHCKLKNNENN